MKVPEQSNTTINTVTNETGDNIPMNEEQNSTQYVMPAVRQRTQQQQQLLLVNINKLYAF